MNNVFVFLHFGCFVAVRVVVSSKMWHLCDESIIPNQNICFIKIIYIDNKPYFSDDLIHLKILHITYIFRYCSSSTHFAPACTFFSNKIYFLHHSMLQHKIESTFGEIEPNKISQILPFISSLTASCQITCRCTIDWKIFALISLSSLQPFLTRSYSAGPHVVVHCPPLQISIAPDAISVCDRNGCDRRPPQQIPFNTGQRWWRNFN